MLRRRTAEADYQVPPDERQDADDGPLSIADAGASPQDRYGDLADLIEQAYAEADQQ